jgi:hypothetical protein
MKQENAPWMNRLLDELQEFLYKRGATLQDNATIVEGNGYSGVVKIKLEISGYLADSDSAPASPGKDGSSADCPCKTCRLNGSYGSGPKCPRSQIVYQCGYYGTTGGWGGAVGYGSGGGSAGGGA